MKLSLYDVFGNRLLVASYVADDGALRASNDLARRCFVGGRRIADGVALFSPRPGFLRTAFYNPDGSFERLCGNSLLAAAKVLVEAGQSATVRPFALPPIELVHSRSGYLEASSEVELARAVIEVPGFGRVPVFDTGSPHAVVSVYSDNFDLAGAGREFVREADVNLTLVACTWGRPSRSDFGTRRGRRNRSLWNRRARGGAGVRAFRPVDRHSLSERALPRADPSSRPSASLDAARGRESGSARTSRARGSG